MNRDKPAEDTHTYIRLTPDTRPQDPSMKGLGLTFTTLEHGGDVDDLMPQAILLTDAQGRQCRYEPVRVDGQVVHSLGRRSRVLGEEGLDGVVQAGLFDRLNDPGVSATWRTSPDVLSELDAAAVRFIAGEVTEEDSGAKLSMPVPDFRARVAVLLRKHFEMELIELQKLAPHRRMRLAAEVAVAEHLERLRGGLAPVVPLTVPRAPNSSVGAGFPPGEVVPDRSEDVPPDSVE